MIILIIDITFLCCYYLNHSYIVILQVKPGLSTSIILIYTIGVFLNSPGIFIFINVIDTFLGLGARARV